MLIVKLQLDFAHLCNQNSAGVSLKKEDKICI
jgi:hypothetical protein